MTSNDKKIIIEKLTNELIDIRGSEENDYLLGCANGLQTAIDIVDEIVAIAEEDVVSRNSIAQSIMERYCQHCTNAMSLGGFNIHSCDHSCDHKKDIDIIMNYGG